MKHFPIYAKTVSLLLILLLACPFAGTAAQVIQNITVQAAEQLIKNPPANLVILDVRTPAEYREGHLPHAKNLNFFGGSFDMDLQSMPKDQPILLYCRSGRRSAAAASLMEDAGFTDIRHMNEGMNGWQKAGLPLSKD